MMYEINTERTPVQNESTYNATGSVDTVCVQCVMPLVWIMEGWKLLALNVGYLLNWNSLNRGYHIVYTALWMGQPPPNTGTINQDFSVYRKSSQNLYFFNMRCSDWNVSIWSVAPSQEYKSEASFT